MSEPEPGANICEIDLRSLTEHGLDISQTGTRCRYRLIDCAAFVDHGKLIVREYVDFPQVPYAAVSYVWRGNEVDPELTGPSFSVKGAEDADPIGLEVLREACRTSSAHGATHLWLDRLCIMQTDKKDKQWQIRVMYDIYSSCHICVVTPGGTQRLVRLDEETQWIHRGWTLQEAVAPPRVVVLFSWKLGQCEAYIGSSFDTRGVIREITPKKSAVMSLSLITDACTTGNLSIQKNNKSLLVEVKLFSSHPSDRSYRDFPFWQPTRRVLSPNIGALARIMRNEVDQDAKDHSIWQSALMRTSSRPVDMVFSIMGLFGVALDTSQFGPLDRVPATIALARAILEKDGRGRASWLAAAFRIPPSRQISTFPVFPRTSVAGKAEVKIADGLQEVSLLMENEYPVARALVPMPCATMEENGYLSFTAKAVRLDSSPANASRSSSNLSEPDYVKAIDGSWWKICEDQDVTKGQTFAVLVGFFVGYYPGSTPAQDANNIRAMIVQEHAPGKSHVRSYLTLSLKAKSWANEWPERTFCIGGPDVEAIEEDRDSEDLPRIPLAREQYLNNPRHMLQLNPTLEDMETRRARWATPQEVLEREYG
jgi:hypothetical protein